MQTEGLKTLEFGDKIWIKDAGEAIFLRFLPHFRRNPVICVKWIYSESSLKDSAVVLAVRPDMVSLESTEDTSAHLSKFMREVMESTHLISGRIIVLETIRFK